MSFTCTPPGSQFLKASTSYGSSGMQSSSLNAVGGLRCHSCRQAASFEGAQRQMVNLGKGWKSKGRCGSHLPAIQCSMTAAAGRGSMKKLEYLDPEFYRMGYERAVRAYGVEFMEGPKGIGLYAARDIKNLSKPRIVMEIPLENMLSVSSETPWTFAPDIIPLNHPLFDVINSTNPEAMAHHIRYSFVSQLFPISLLVCTDRVLSSLLCPPLSGCLQTDWDLRLACVLLLGIEQEDNFWNLYQDYLPQPDDNPYMLLATHEELNQLQDNNLARYIQGQQIRADNAHSRYWGSGQGGRKLQRLAPTPEQLKWALGTVSSRCFTMTISIGTLVSPSNLLIPYADMLNHSFSANCTHRWRRKDRMLEIVVNPGNSINAGDELTLAYNQNEPNDTFMKMYGFSYPKNPWDSVNISCNESIHLDSFLSAFNIAGLAEEYHFNVPPGEWQDPFQDGLLLAAARCLPTWSDGDTPCLPTHERRAARDIQRACEEALASYPTPLEDDRELFLEKGEGVRQQWVAALKYRMHRKMLLKKMIKALDIYLDRLLF